MSITTLALIVIGRLGSPTALTVQPEARTAKIKSRDQGLRDIIRVSAGRDQAGQSDQLS